MSLFRRPATFEFPGPRDRVAIVGSTGSGKSTGAIWMFSESADFDKKPWVFVDFKGEDIISEMTRRKLAAIIEVSDDPPTRPGIYVLSPSPHEMDLTAAWLWKVWKHGRTGLVFDELYMVPEFKGKAGTGGPLKSILTQGRSKEIPVYGLSQRPVDVNLHMFTEAQFIWSFGLTTKSDRQRVGEYVPDDNPVFADKKVLPRHWSRWFDQKRNAALYLKPCPDAKEILDTIRHRVDIMQNNKRL